MENSESHRKITAINLDKGSITLLPQQAYEAHFQADADFIGFAFDSQSGEHAYNSDRKTPFVAKPYSLAFVPKGCDVYSQSSLGGEYLTVQSSKKRLNKYQFNNIQYKQAEHAAHLLRYALLTQKPFCSLELEKLVNDLEQCIDQVFEKEKANKEKQWMTYGRFTRIEEFVEAHLSEKLTIAMLAKELNLSEGFFQRAFKQSLGQTPYDFIMDRRLSRARKLLETSTLSLSEIALMTGFSSHVHMSFAFKRRTHINPSALQHR